MKNEKKQSARHTFSGLTATATIDELLFLQELLKQLADDRGARGYSHEQVQLGWKAIDTSSIEAHVSGNLMLSDGSEPLRLAYVTAFLFTCIKEHKQEYSLEGSFSLS